MVHGSQRPVAALNGRGMSNVHMCYGSVLQSRRGRLRISCWHVQLMAGNLLRLWLMLIVMVYFQARGQPRL